MCAEVNWEDGVPEPVRNEWSDLRDELSGIDSIKLPRAAVITKGDLHIFCDASQKAYVAVAYVVSDGAVLLTSKCKVAPLKTRSLPQLDLTAFLDRKSVG